MSHNRFQEDLPAYIANRLEGEDLRRLQEHLEECADCREMASAWREIAATMREAGEAVFEPHPGEEDLRAFALGGNLAASERMRIERHTEICMPCGLELKAWHTRRPALSHRSFRSGPWWRPGVLKAAGLSAAAGLVLGLTAGALVWRAPQSSDLPAPASASSWAGPTLQILLPGPVRGGSPSVVTRRIDPEEKRVVVAFPPLDSRFRDDDGLYRFEIAAPSSGSVLSVGLTGSQARSHLETVGVITFDLPASRLQPDRYVCRVIAPDGAVIYQASLELAPAN